MIEMKWLCFQKHIILTKDTNKTKTILEIRLNDNHAHSNFHS